MAYIFDESKSRLKIIEITGTKTGVESGAKAMAVITDVDGLSDFNNLVVLSVSQKITVTNGTTVIYGQGSFWKDETTKGVYPRADIYASTNLGEKEVDILLYNPTSETVDITYRVLLINLG